MNCMSFFGLLVMAKENARRQTLQKFHERRTQVVRLHKKGIKIMEIVEMTGLNFLRVRTAIDFFDACSWRVIRPARHGRRQTRRSGAHSRAREKTIQRMIIDRLPHRLKREFRCGKRPWRRGR